MTGAALIVQGDALHLPLPDASVDLVVTSPPYAFLRAYDTGYPHLEVGAEPTPTEFLEHLWQATAEMVRVLKPTGSIFVDLGDKYSTGNSGQSGLEQPGARYAGGGHTDQHAKQASRPVPGMPPKCLLLLPERYRIGCVDTTSPHHRAQFYQQLADDLIDSDITPEHARQLAAEFEASPKSKGLGLIARAVIVWDKPNGLPESVTDRVRRSHEDWVHLTKQPRYYSAIDEIREAYDQTPGAIAKRRNGQQFNTAHPSGFNNSVRKMTDLEGGRPPYENPLGKLPGSVWSIASEPLRLPDHLGVQHYAAFPSEWPRRLILGWSPPGICLDCEQGRVPVVERNETRYSQLRDNPGDVGRWEMLPGGVQKGLHRPGWRHEPPPTATILGYACACTPYTNHPGSGGGDWGSYDGGMSGAPAADGKRHSPENYRPKVGSWREYHLEGWRPPPTKPAVVLDSFGGTGTTALVARALGRIGITVDLSWPYSRLAKYRIFHSGDSGKALSRTWAERQGSLLSDAPSAEGS